MGSGLFLSYENVCMHVLPRRHNNGTQARGFSDSDSKHRAGSEERIDWRAGVGNGEHLGRKREREREGEKRKWGHILQSMKILHMHTIQYSPSESPFSHSLPLLL